MTLTTTTHKELADIAESFKANYSDRMDPQDLYEYDESNEWGFTDDELKHLLGLIHGGGPVVPGSTLHSELEDLIYEFQHNAEAFWCSHSAGYVAVAAESGAEAVERAELLIAKIREIVHV